MTSFSLVNSINSTKKETTLELKTENKNSRKRNGQAAKDRPHVIVAVGGLASFETTSDVTARAIISASLFNGGDPISERGCTTIGVDEGGIPWGGGVETKTTTATDGDEGVMTAWQSR
ncbi:hypothetical protein U1Q18_006062 [Sarracenia purpurea var. burkii]